MNVSRETAIARQSKAPINMIPIHRKRPKAGWQNRVTHFVSRWKQKNDTTKQNKTATKRMESV